MIGSRIRSARQSRGWTQAVLAQKTGLTTKYLSNVECGEKLPKFETFILITYALGVDANSLLVDVLDVSPSIVATKLEQKLVNLPPQRQKRLLHIIDLMIEDAEQGQQN